MKAVIDTNILIDYLTGYDGAAAELDRYGDPVISRISWVEVLVGAVPGAEEREIREFLRRFTVYELDGQVAEEAVQVRRTRRLRLPDALVLATAHVLGCLLVSRNTRDFDTAWPEIRVPYQL